MNGAIFTLQFLLQNFNYIGVVDVHVVLWVKYCIHKMGRMWCDIDSDLWPQTTEIESIDPWGHSSQLWKKRPQDLPAISLSQKVIDELTVNLTFDPQNLITLSLKPRFPQDTMYPQEQDVCI